MKNIRITSKVSDDFVMPGDILPLLPQLSGNQLKVLIYAFAKKEFELSACSKDTEIPLDEVNGIMEFLSENSILSSENKPSKEQKKHELLQTYDSETLADAMNTDNEFLILKEAVEDMLGTILNKNDIGLLYNVYHFSGLGADFVCAITAYAVSKNKGNMRYITQTALSMYDEGVDTYDKLEEELALRRENDSNRAKFISLCGFGTRKLTSTEEGYITKWFTEFALPFEVIKTAYEKMIDLIGQVKLKYMDKIVSDWYSNGVRSPEDAISAKNNDTKPKSDEKSKLEQSFDVNDFISAALEKSNRE